ncbi:quercetin dioxygenase-like cupin family protein [Lewinella aquimaris]|uniref:Quercetin dioxygenase-like cupin family protein n=1 Tax=Neolewinella aquimaris TaxID=1835722 RepID=A0A840E3R6_9BACT|nr:cupin domain-containing protein [Neolewinella aquimaris]MBB4079720.1 quercetin dioxygenase-like cupin family protein [Neolewinella aquimaris]
MKRIAFLRTTLAAAGAVTAFRPLSASPALPADTDQLEPRIVLGDEGQRVNVLGDQMTFKLTGKDTAGQVTVIEEANDPGVMIPPHVHDNEDEIFRVLEGALEVTVGGETTVLHAGDMAFGPRGIPHSWKTVGEGKTRVILTAFPSGIETMFEEIGALPAGPPDMPTVFGICARYGIRFV